MRKLLPTLFFLLLLSWTAAAQPAEESRESRARAFFGDLWEDQRTIWSSPFRQQTWSSESTYLLMGLSAASFSLDGNPSRCVRESGRFERLNELLAATPADVTLTVYPLGLLAAGELTGSRTISDYGMKATRSSLNAIAVTAVIKAATNRARPHTGKVYGFWEGGNSFLSGHAAVAWALAATTVRQFPKQKWVPWVAFPVAGLVSFARVTSGNHFVSDTVTGAAFGFAIGYYGVQ